MLELLTTDLARERIADSIRLATDPTRPERSRERIGGPGAMVRAFAEWLHAPGAETAWRDAWLAGRSAFTRR
jgi:hypothetical protein